MHDEDLWSYYSMCGAYYLHALQIVKKLKYLQKEDFSKSERRKKINKSLQTYKSIT